MSEHLFDDLTDIYERLVDWPKRLHHEEPFYRALLDRAGARSVVDVACGTGRHAAMFRSWGLRVEGADISPHMIERARTMFGEADGLRWVVRGFDDSIAPEQPFDVAVCVGNSLALASDMSEAERAIQQMCRAVGDGGLIAIHVLNLWRLPDGPCVWQKHQLADLPQGKVMIAKGIHRVGSRGYVDLLVTPLASPEETHSESIRLLGFESAGLASMARQAGAAAVEFYGGYQSQPYDRDQSVDLIMVARR